MSSDNPSHVPVLEGVADPARAKRSRNWRRVGIVLFLLIGNAKLPRKRRERQKEVDGIIAASVDTADYVADRSAWPAWFASIVRQRSV